MKNFKRLMVVFLSLLLLFAIGGCGGNNQSEENTGGKTTQLSFATAGTGGTFYPLGGGIAKIINEHYPNLNVTAEATGGSVENARLLTNHTADIAFMSADTAYEAYEGIGAFNESMNVLALMTTYNQPTHFIALADSDINSIEDIKGKKVAVGSPGSGTEHKTAQILESLGITYDDFDEQFLSFSESASALKDGDIDAAIMGVGAPAAAVMDLGATHDYKLISLTDSEIEKVMDKYPYYQPTVIKAGTYEQIDYDVKTVGAAILITVRADMDEELAYTLTEAMFAYPDELEPVHAMAKEINHDNALPTVIPLHPGAEKYYQEHGVTE